MLEATNHHARLASQRVLAEGAVSAVARDGGTHVMRLYQDGAAKIRLPKRADGAFEAVLINTAGGLTGGDQLGWSVDVGAGASVTLTTQACEKIYRSSHGKAALSCRLTVGEGASAAWLPQETILFDRSALHRRLDVDLASNARVLISEATIFGRRAMGETVRQAVFRDRWRVRQNGRVVHAEDFAIGPDTLEMLAHSAVAGGRTAMATVLLVGEEEDGNRLDAVRAIIGDEGGASYWTVGRSGKLLARLVAGDGYALRKRLLPLLRMLNGEAGLPKVWTF